MPDIFQRKTDVFGGSFAADMARISFPNLGGLAGNNLAQDVMKRAYAGEVGLLVQRLNVTYQQQVTRLYEVGRPAIYYVGGRTAGDAGVDRVVGPRIIANEFYRKYGDVCQARTNSLAITLCIGCGSDTEGNPFLGAASYTAYYAVIVSIGLAIESQNMLINESLRLMFSSFDYEVRQGPNACDENQPAASQFQGLGQGGQGGASTIAANTRPGGVFDRQLQGTAATT